MVNEAIYWWGLVIIGVTMAVAVPSVVRHTMHRIAGPHLPLKHALAMVALESLAGVVLSLGLSNVQPFSAHSDLLNCVARVCAIVFLGMLIAMGLMDVIGARITRLP